MPPKTLQIRNSTTEFLIFTKQAGKSKIEVRVQDGTIWHSQKPMVTLFYCSGDSISLHLKNIFAERELDEISVTEDFSVTAASSKNYSTRHYNLDAIIAGGYWYTQPSERRFCKKIADIYSTAMDYNKNTLITEVSYGIR